MTRIRWVVLSTAFALAPRICAAQPFDHLECYNVKDSHAFDASVELEPFQAPPFPVATGCQVKVKGQQFCIPVEKRLIQTDAPSLPVVGQNLENDFICYKLKCPVVVPPIADVTVADQFGERTLKKFTAKTLCVPAVKSVTTTTTTTTVTTTTLCAQACPDQIRFTVKAGVGALCASDVDCGGGFCDTGIGRCRTDTNVDLGWTGHGFDTDLNDNVKLHLDLSCPGGGSPGPCGDCSVTGWNCDDGTCRCKNDNQTICSTAFATGGPCGTSTCVPYAGPPLPAAAIDQPVCAVTEIAAPPSGTYNIDSGAANLAVELRSIVHLIPLSDLVDPCPVCQGDVTACDGVADGTCNGGLNHGSSCDAGGANSCFPAPGGEAVSLDCFPDPMANVSGPGLAIDLDPLTTGTVSLPFAVPCDAPLGHLDCPCAVCSGDTSIPCSSDAQCGAVGAGTCSASGPAGALRIPNSCDTLVCNPTTTPPYAPDGKCDAGPFDDFCDGITRPDGEGLIPCLINADCALWPGAGSCTMTERRECFSDPIVATGSGASDPSSPRMVAAMCLPPTATPWVNVPYGFPGPGRIAVTAETFMTCPSNPSLVYSPGTGF